MYRFLVKFFAQKNSSVLKKITGGHFSQNKSVGFRCHEHGYFTSLNKAQFFGEKPLHPSLLTELSEIRNDTDSIPENGKKIHEFSFYTQNLLFLTLQQLWV